MKDTKQQWFKDAKFGLFIHWGLYALLAGEYNGKKTDRIAEWIMNDLDIPVEEYEKLASQFNPVEFDAEMIVRKAKRGKSDSLRQGYRKTVQGSLRQV